MSMSLLMGLQQIGGGSSAGLLPQAAGALRRCFAQANWGVSSSSSQSFATHASPAKITSSSIKKAGTKSPAAKGKASTKAKAPKSPVKKPAAKPAAKTAAPKVLRALSAYALFVQATRSQWFAPGIVGPVGMAKAGAAWKSMGDGEKVGCGVVACGWVRGLARRDVTREGRPAARAAR
jgi:hypothetical protein